MLVFAGSLIGHVRCWRVEVRLGGQWGDSM